MTEAKIHIPATTNNFERATDISSQDQLGKTSEREDIESWRVQEMHILLAALQL
jgi:hypothetical protein